MADEVTPLDPLDELLKAHVAKMGEILTSSVDKTDALCNESLLGVKKRTGLRSQALDRALASIGIVEATV